MSVKNTGMDLQVTFWNHLTGSARKHSRGLNPALQPWPILYFCYGKVNYWLGKPQSQFHLSWESDAAIFEYLFCCKLQRIYATQ